MVGGALVHIPGMATNRWGEPWDAHKSPSWTAPTPSRVRPTTRVSDRPWRPGAACWLAQGRQSHRIIGGGHKRRLDVWGLKSPSGVQGWNLCQFCIPHTSRHPKILGGHKRRLDVWGLKSPSGVQGWNLCQFCIPHTSRHPKILGGHYHGCLPLHKYWRNMSSLSHRDRRPWIGPWAR